MHGGGEDSVHLIELLDNFGAQPLLTNLSLNNHSLRDETIYDYKRRILIHGNIWQHVAYCIVYC